MTDLTIPVIDDPWAGIRRAFPEECERISEITGFVRSNPGCRASEIRSCLGCDGMGLFRILFQMHKEGTVVLERGMNGGLYIPYDHGACPHDGAISTEPTAKSGQMGSA